MTETIDPFIWRPGQITANTVPKGTSLPLEGLRLAVKDLFHIAGVPTSAGNPDWLRTHEIPSQTSSVVQKILGAGATLEGKTLTDELAYSLNGQNSHYGTPLNASAPDRLPGGSSSGSAAAVAHDLADIGLGTDTGGSIRVPSSYNGLYGLRPTHDVVNTDNMVALAPGFDTVGWMTRDLGALFAVANVLFAGTEVNVADVQKPVQICWSETLNNMVAHQKDIATFTETIASQHNIATQTIEFSPELLPAASEAFRVLQGIEIWQQHGNWITSTHPKFASDIKARLNWCATLTNEDEKRAQAAANEINQEISAILKPDMIFLMPTTPGPAPLLKTDTDDLVNYRNHLLGLTALAGLGGLPQLHLPLKVHKAPAVGVSLLGNKHTDLQLIHTAAKLIGVLL